jgi:hypothetical protein
MAIDANSYIQQGQSYAAGLGAAQDPLINLRRNRLGTMKSREALAAEIAGLYSPAIQAAQGVGANVAGVGQAGLAGIAGLASSLPGMDVEALSDAYRGAARAGGSAALLGSTLESGARQALAESILQRQRESDETRFDTENKLAEYEAEKARLAADYLGAAQGFQGMGQTAQQMQFAAEEQPLKIEGMRANIANILANTGLTNAEREGLIQNTAFEAQLQPGKVKQQGAEYDRTVADTEGVEANTKQTIKETASMLPPERARYYADLIANNELTASMLQNGQIVADLEDAGYTVTTKNGKITVSKDGKVVFRGPDRRQRPGGGNKDKNKNPPQPVNRGGGGKPGGGQGGGGKPGGNKPGGNKPGGNKPGGGQGGGKPKKT